MLLICHYDGIFCVLLFHFSLLFNFFFSILYFVLVEVIKCESRF